MLVLSDLFMAFKFCVQIVKLYRHGFQRM